MAQSPLEKVISTWNKRAQQFSAQGINPNVIKQIGQNDINKVKQGGSALNDTEARLALTAAGTGQAIVPEKKRGTGILDLPGNLVKDIGDTARGMIGMPETIIQAGRDLRNDSPDNYEKSGLSPSGLAAAVRNIAHHPAGKFLPFVGTAAGLTTPEGRQELKRHPLGPVTDAAIVGSIAGKALAGGRLAAAGEIVNAGEGVAAPEGFIPHLDHHQGFYISPEASKTLLGQTALKGIPIKGLAEQIPVVGEKIQRLEEKVALSRGFSTAESRVKRQYKDMFATDIESLTHDLTPEEKVAFWDHAENGTVPTEPAQQVAYDKYKTINRAIRNGLTEDELLVSKEFTIDTPSGPITREFTFPNTGPAARAVKLPERIATNEEFLARNHQKLIDAVERVQKIRDGYITQMEKKREVLNELKTRNPSPHVTRRIGKLEDDMAALNDKIVKSFAEHKGYNRALKMYDKRLAGIEANRAELTDFLKNNAPAEYHPQLQSQLRDITRLRIENMQAAPEIIEAAMQAFSRGDYSSIWTPQEYAYITKSIEQGWQSLVKEGFTPEFVHVVTPTEMGRAATKPLDHHFTPGQVKERIWSNMTPHFQDLAVSISHSALDFLRYKQNEQAFMDVILPRSQTLAEVNAEIEPALTKAIKKGTRPDIARKYILDTEYVKINDLEEFSFRNPRVRAVMGKNERFLRKDLYDTWRELAFTPVPKGIRKGLTTVNAAFKVSLFTISLRHAADEILGGMVMVMGRGGKEEIMSSLDAWRMVKEDRLPVELPQGIDINTPDELVQMAGGAKAAKILSKIHNGKAGALIRTEVFFANVQRAMALLGEEKRAIGAGFSPEVARELGIKHVEKTLVDWYGMLPIERTAIKQIFPFYAFAKYSLQYALTYPIDHPYRASILYHLGQAEQQDWDSGLPQLWQQLYFIGKPNAQGNTKAIDLRVINPFRDVDSFFSLKGFYNQLGPVPKSALIPLGVNPISAAPDLYPEITYNQETGKLEGAREPAGSVANQILTSVLPPVRSLDYFLKYSKEMRNLKASNPDAYNRSVFSALGIPGVPSNYNITKSRATSELARYSMASKAAAGAVKSGDLGSAADYPVLPFQGSLTTPQTLETLLNQLQTQPGISPKATMKPTKRRKQTGLVKAPNAGS